MPATVADKVEKLYEDMYIGKDADNPPVTMRLDRLEKLASDWKTLKWTLVGAIITMLADIISNHVKF